MPKGICNNCGSKLIAPKSGLCLECGVRNEPLVNPEADRKASEELRLQKEKAEIFEIISAVEAAIINKDALQANTLLKSITQRVSALNNPAITIRFYKVELDNWQMQSIIDKAIESLKKLVGLLPFEKENYEYFYRAAVSYQEKGNHYLAHRIFKKFLDNFASEYKDVSKRCQESADRTINKSIFDGEPVNVCFFELKNGIARLSGTLNNHSNRNLFFSNAVLLNEGEIEDKDKDYVEDVINEKFHGKLDLEKVLSRLENKLQISRLTASIEHISLHYDQTGRSAEDDQCIFLRLPEGTFSFCESGYVALVPRLIASQLNPGNISIFVYVLYLPKEDGERENINTVEFNSKLLEEVMKLYPIKRNAGLYQAIASVKKNTIDAVKLEMASSYMGPSEW